MCTYIWPTFALCDPKWSFTKKTSQNGSFVKKVCLLQDQFNRQWLKCAFAKQTYHSNLSFDSYFVTASTNRYWVNFFWRENYSSLLFWGNFLLWYTKMPILTFSPQFSVLIWQIFAHFENKLSEQWTNQQRRCTNAQTSYIIPRKMLERWQRVFLPSVFSLIKRNQTELLLHLWPLSWGSPTPAQKRARRNAWYFIRWRVEE